MTWVEVLVSKYDTTYQTINAVYLLVRRTACTGVHWLHGNPSANLPICGTVRAAGRPGGGAGGAASGAPLLSAAQPARQVASAAHSCVEPERACNRYDRGCNRTCNRESTLSCASA